jgi:hypothetical protein
VSFRAGKWRSQGACLQKDADDGHQIWGLLHRPQQQRRLLNLGVPQVRQQPRGRHVQAHLPPGGRRKQTLSEARGGGGDLVGDLVP